MSFFKHRSLSCSPLFFSLLPCFFVPQRLCLPALRSLQNFPVPFFALFFGHVNPFFWRHSPSFQKFPFRQFLIPPGGGGGVLGDPHVFLIAVIVYRTGEEQRKRRRQPGDILDCTRSYQNVQERERDGGR